MPDKYKLTYAEMSPAYCYSGLLSLPALQVAEKPHDLSEARILVLYPGLVTSFKP
jgi:hypothetical protein